MKHGPIKVYAHAEHDEEAEEYVEDVYDDAGLSEEDVPRDKLTEFFSNRPLYEVCFDYYYDTETGEFDCEKVSGYA